MKRTRPDRSRSVPFQRRDRTPWIVTPVLALLTLGFYRHIALTDMVLSGVDAFTYFYPYRAYAAEIVRSGSIPLWDPYLFLGAPFLANPQAAVFYPFNLALSALSGPEIVTWSIVLHVTLAGLFAYLYARSILRLSLLPALLGATAFCFGGFLSGQIEHINQLNVSAWFPLLLLLWELGAGRIGLPDDQSSHARKERDRRQRLLLTAGRARWLALLALGLVIGLGLLAGHTQSSYISLFGLGAYALSSALVPCTGRQNSLFSGAPESGSCQLPDAGQTRPRRRQVASVLLARLWHVAWCLGVAAFTGAGIAAVQLLPTLELSGLSIRSGGLSYREVVAFSLKPTPRLLWHSFLPPWGRNLADAFGGDFYTEYLAYVGVIPLLLASLAVLGALARGRRLRLKHGSSTRREAAANMVILAAVGILLALGIYNPLYFVLYKVAPGFGLFRVPARWMLLYAFGTAMLAGLGLQIVEDWLSRRVGRRAGRAVAALLALVGLIELFDASRVLAFQTPTAPEAFSSLRTAPAHILAAQQAEPAPGRFLSMSDIEFDPGDLADIQHMFRDALSPKAIYDYVVCVKRQEIIAPNLPLSWRVYAVDGYDGGVLPLAQYAHLQRLFLDESDLLSDGRLREGLTRIPPSRLLSILGVRYVITDKVHDVWIDDVFYDMAFDAELSKESPSIDGEVAPAFAATAVGLVSYMEEAKSIASGTPVADIKLRAKDGETQTLTLYAGTDTAEGLYRDDVAHRQARVGRGWDDELGGNDYVSRRSLDQPMLVSRVEVNIRASVGRFHIRGLALIDERDGSNVPVILSTEGRFRQVHSGDVKIYEVLDALPRAHIAHRTRVLADDDTALAAMADPTFDLASEVILHDGQELRGSLSTESSAEVTVYAPEQVAVLATLSVPGYLVLSDSWYPGWRATVDGQPAQIERANVAFRAVYLPAGTHTVRFTYRPTSYLVGLLISFVATASLILAVVVAWRRFGTIGTADV